MATIFGHDVLVLISTMVSPSLTFSPSLCLSLSLCLCLCLSVFLSVSVSLSLSLSVSLSVSLSLPLSSSLFLPLVCRRRGTPEETPFQARSAECNEGPWDPKIDRTSQKRSWRGTKVTLPSHRVHLFESCFIFFPSHRLLWANRDPNFHSKVTLLLENQVLAVQTY